MATEMTKYEAERLLGLTGEYTKQDLNREYRKKVKEYHPDLVAARGGDPLVAEELMVHINEAKQYLDDFFQDAETVKCSSSPDEPVDDDRGSDAYDYGCADGNGTDAGSRSDYSEDASDDNAWRADWEGSDDRQNEFWQRREKYGKNPDGSWNVYPPWRYETGEPWEQCDPMDYLTRGPFAGPYGGHPMDSEEGKQSFRYYQRKEYAHQRAREKQQRQAEEREWLKEHNLDRMPFPIALFRWYEGEMPDKLRKRYDRVENFPYRILLALAGFVFCSSYVICDVRQMDIAMEGWYICSAYGVFFIAAINLFTGWVTSPIKDALLRRLDRKLAAWRERTDSRADSETDFATDQSSKI